MAAGSGQRGGPAAGGFGPGAFTGFAPSSRQTLNVRLRGLGGERVFEEIDPEAGGAVVFLKPFRVEQLAATLRKLLGVCDAVMSRGGATPP